MKTKLIVEMRKLANQGESANLSDLMVAQQMFLELEDPPERLEHEYKAINRLVQKKKQEN